MFEEDIMSASKLAAHSSRCSTPVGSPIDTIVSRYVDYLRERRYASETIQRYLASLRYFARRLNKRLTLDDIDDALQIAARHGCHPLRGVATYEDTYKLAYVRGPSGIIVMLAEELKKG